MLIETLRTPLKRARITNYATNGFPTYGAQGTRPNTTDDSSATGQEAIELTQDNGGSCPNWVILVPFAVGADDVTFSMRVLGWERTVGLVGKEVADTDLWVPSNLGEFLCTAGTSVGVAGRYVADTERFADTITLVGTSGVAGQSCQIVSPADNTIACVKVDLKGSSILEIIFTVGVSATSCNALYCLT